ncbi:helix-turn-helix domain-containing protein [Thermomonospora amylolytica]|uniref:helix-turn-helix domain-containing protein n=1 Tax=Thermomonospora amylolytica TaxID=1411117 RepID=UPI002278C25E|nr:helix-turn-helix transcriptional regulator [Thermomonospora amylolytica]
MDERRAELGLDWQEVADQAGITREGLRRIRRGTGKMRAKTMRGIERALRWKPGSIDAILAWGDPNPEPEPEPPAETAVEKLAKLLGEMEATMDRIESMLDERGRRLMRAGREIARTAVESQPHDQT